MNSNAFFATNNCPANTNLLLTLITQNPKNKEFILQSINGARVVVNTVVFDIVLPKFLEHKRRYGTPKEKNLYARLDRKALLRRLVANRPLVFCGQSNMTLLPNASEVLPHPTHAWKAVGTDFEHPHLPLEQYMTFDEMALAALIGVSAPTLFINNGARHNNARPDPPGTFTPFGIYTGLVGARFEVEDAMESVYILVSEKQSTPTNGFGLLGRVRNQEAFDKLSVLARVFGKYDFHNNVYYFPSYSEVERLKEEEQQRKGYGKKSFVDDFVKIRHGVYFNVNAYRKRIQVSAETLLLEANLRGAETGKLAFVHVVGLGLGVWQTWSGQDDIYVSVFGDVMSRLSLTNVGVVNFSWIQSNSCNGVRHGQKIRGPDGHEILIEFSNRNPADLLVGREQENMLLVASFAWDSNSFVGNEYWLGMLDASGDPAAAACSTIGEVLNPLVNKEMLDNVVELEGELR
ncbi:hypothetical protein BDR26DRAFT_859041, partial [Obelidium mucronatum]